MREERGCKLILVSSEHEASTHELKSDGIISIYTMYKNERKKDQA